MAFDDNARPYPQPEGTQIVTGPTDLLGSSSAPGPRLEQAPAELATWQHAVDEANLAIAQMAGSAHIDATMAPYPGTSVADTTPTYRPASPGQAPSASSTPAELHGQGD